MPRLTTKYIQTNVHCPDAGQLIIRDDELKGFALRLTKGSMSFIAERRIDGQLRRVTLGKFGAMTPDQARRKARDFLSEAMAEVASHKPKPSSVTLEEVLAKFLQVRKLRPNTIRNYAQITKRCLGDWLNLPITEITRDMIQARHQALTRPTRRGTSGEVQANMAMRILRTLLNFAAINYETTDGQPLIATNPVCRLSQNRSWHKEPRRRVIIPDSQLGPWYRAVISLRQTILRDYLILVLLTGLRRNEAASLRWTDVSFESKTLTIRAEVAKNKKEHTLPLTDFLVLLLSQRLQRKHGSEFVFPSRSGKGHIVEAKHAIESVAKSSGCSFVTHDLRRTNISLAARIGIPHHIIKKLVNNSASRDVTDGYVVIDAEHLREPMEQINNRLLTLFGCSIEDWRPGGVAAQNVKLFARRPLIG